MSVRGDDGEGMRWAARPALARGVRTAVFVLPVAASVGTSWLAHRALGTAGSRADQVWHLAVLVGVSTLTLVLVDRLARRALPLATLLELTMLFPDEAPSRVAVAREASRARPVEEQLARVREAGADPATAAREILGLVAALRAHDRPTRGHAERVRMFTDLVAEAMNVPERDRDLLRWAAILHDIGKLRIPSTLLNKPGKPTDDEWVLLRAHPAHGAEIAGALLPWLGEWGDVIVQHHERYDGTGYPQGLAGREISLGGRIVAVADAYDVMTAARAYRRPVSRAAANRELVKWSGRQFDPVVVRAMVGLSAPRLRRAQGLLAWLSDIPMVATGYVPAATVARVVGAGALATGAATGVTGPAVALGHGTAPDADQPSTTTRSAPRAAQSGEQQTRSTPSNQADVSVPLADPAAGPPAPGTGAGAPPAAADPSTASGGGAPATDPATDPGTGSGSGSGGGRGAGGVAGTGTVTGPLADKVTSTVGGTVTSTGKTVTGTVDTVTDVVDGAVGAVTGILGGKGKGSSGSSGSGHSGSGSGSSGPGSGSLAGTVDGTTTAVTGTVDDTTGAVTGTATTVVTGTLNKLGGLLGGKRH